MKLAARNTHVDHIMAQVGYEPSDSEYHFNFATADGSAVATVTSSIRGIRDLRAAIMALAVAVDQQASVQRATLIVLSHRMKSETISKEWMDACHTFRPNVRGRLELLAVNRHGTTSVPADRQPLSGLAAALQTYASGDNEHRVELSAPSGTRSTSPAQPLTRPSLHYVILKILLLRYLQRQGPLTNKTLCELTGCSYPTLAKSLQPLRPHLAQHSDRSVELESWPQAAWDEVVTLSTRIRNTIRFTDASGESPEPAKLLARLNKMRTRGLAVGGVLAARYWDSQLDLHGTPRLDLSLHAPAGNPDLGFMKRLDPALRPSMDPGEPVSAAIHTVYRSESLFAENSEGKLQWADPVETLLDLHELRLTKQAAELAKRLRAKKHAQ